MEAARQGHLSQDGIWQMSLGHSQEGLQALSGDAATKAPQQERWWLGNTGTPKWGVDGKEEQQWRSHPGATQGKRNSAVGVGGDQDKRKVRILPRKVRARRNERRNERMNE